MFVDLLLRPLRNRVPDSNENEHLIRFDINGRREGEWAHWSEAAQPDSGRAHVCASVNWIPVRVRNRRPDQLQERP